jgi:hypothetical protein
MQFYTVPNAKMERLFLGSVFGYTQRCTLFTVQLKALAQVAMFLTCGVEFAGSNLDRDSPCHEIFLTFLATSRENIYVAPEWLRPLSPHRSNLTKTTAVSCNWTLLYCISISCNLCTITKVPLPLTSI